MTLKEYLKGFGYKVSDLTEEELSEAQKELEMVNDGQEILDSVLENPELIYRKMRKEAK